MQYSVHVSESNSGLANLMLEQFGGPQGELAAAMRYFTQALAKEDPGRKDPLMDIATEELSHLEVIGSIVAMLNRGAKGELAEAGAETGQLYRSMQGAGNDSHVTQLLYGGGPALTNSGGIPWTAAYVDSIGDRTCDFRSNIAAEAIDDFLAMDGGDGNAKVKLDSENQACVKASAARTASKPHGNPTMGAELGGR